MPVESPYFQVKKKCDCPGCDPTNPKNHIVKNHDTRNN